MFVDEGKVKNGLVIICDVRHKNDKETQDVEGGTPVLRHWPFGVACLGKRNWANTMRIALYDYGVEVKTLKAEAQAELIAWLVKNKPVCTVVLQTRSTNQKDEDDSESLKGTHCWVAMHAPDSIPEMAGCLWSAPWGQTIGVLNPVNYEYVYREMIRRHFVLGLKVAENGLRAPMPQQIAFVDDENMYACLQGILNSALKGTPIAVDIETFSDLSLITAIGLSDGVRAVAVPCEAYDVYGANRVEPGSSYETIRIVMDILTIKCPKIFHNYTFDVPMLESKGFAVKGPIHDTMAMHDCVYEQYPHGLQKACAQELIVTPWKSEHKPQAAKKLGLKKKDARYWICNPEETRRYCCIDAFNTWRLAQALAPKVGIEW